MDDSFQQVPEVVVSVGVNPDTGQPASDGKASEFFYRENIPPAQKRDAPEGDAQAPVETRTVPF